MLYSYS